MSEPMLPQNIEAELGLLGSMIIDPAAIAQVADTLLPEHFYRHANTVIYGTILQLYVQHVPADFITICDRLEQEDKLEIVGGPGYITGLINQVPTSGNIEHYANIVVRCAMRRRMIHAAGQIAALAYSQQEDSLDEAEQLLFDIRKTKTQAQFTDMPELMSDFMTELDYLYSHRGEFLGVPTGYHDLDVPLAGLQKSDLILLGGRPSMGKTALALCVALNAAARGKHVVIFSLEMGKKLLARRLVAMKSRIDTQRLRGGWVEDDEWERVMSAMENLAQLPISINDAAGNPVKAMREQLRRLTQQKGAPDQIIVDYIGLIEPDADVAKQNNQVQMISAISRGLKMLAREYDAPVLALCQLSRGVEARQNKRPELSDLRDSGSLEQDADVVLFVYRDDYYRIGEAGYEPTHLAEILIKKHRNGPTGTVQLYFKGDLTAFYPLEAGVGGKE